MSSIESPKTAFDFQALGSLKAKAAQDPNDPEAVKTVAQQFEALFLQMMMKSMRAAVPEGGLLDSRATKTFEQMHDQQLVMALSKQGATGLAEMIEQYINRTRGAIDETPSDASFLLNPDKAPGLPLNSVSDGLPLSEEPAHEFLLRRQDGLNDG